MIETIPGVWQAGNIEQLAPTMASDAVFSSPVADYRGAEAVHILGLIAQTIDDVRPTTHWDDGHGDTVTALTGRVNDEPVDGIVRERRNADGLISHVTFYLRPLHRLEVAITHIRALRRQYPVPPRPS